MNKRKLVSIREISAKYPIAKADRLELVQIDGWQCISKKDEFQVGDLCVYFEIDSFLPMEPKYEFLKKTSKCNGIEGYRIKSMKMRGALSQGLALPLNFGFEYDHVNRPWSLGMEVTDVLGVTKYESAQSNFDKANHDKKSKFPSFLPKTDQERIQNLTSYFTTYKDHEFEETLKLDGSSMTVFNVATELSIWDRFKLMIGFNVPNYQFGVCSRNLELPENDSQFWQVARNLNLEKLLPCGYALQGELIGPKIQSNHEKVTDYQFYVFDIYNIEQQRYLTPTERARMMSGSLQSISHVPVISPNTKIFEQHDLESLLKHVEGESMNAKTISEGRVYKSTTNPELTFKVISNNYLMKEK